MDNKYLEDDRPLIEACVRKDIAAWAGLVKKYSPLVIISIKSRLKKYNLSLSRHDIEDIKQDVFAGIWKDNKLKSVRESADISFWIAVVSGNAAMAHFRKKDAVNAGRTVSLNERRGEDELGEFLPSESGKPVDDLARAETLENLNMEIERLPDKERLMIKLNLIHDKKYHEIAEILGVPQGTVSSYIKRAKKKLQNKLQ